ncbi:hypothetical protein PHISCL_01030 [Aspergillus sclerotialis]|uniref:Uncharacterized protein n=1 Tax=Aspergillus sclerotialis TaxID=2070753 RepID=A0A3A2ZU70_9EURO|nr:hypothetical protein PHISCL_01030 [Aspergillus sclerotialis]
MSGPDDRSRWRSGRNDHLHRQSSQRHSGSGPRGTQGGGRGGQNANMTNSWGGSREFHSGPALEQHVPVHGFNAMEAKGALRRGPGEPRPYFYKPTGKDMNNNRTGPWGSRPNTMANGKDFFLELRKQVTALRQGENIAGG